MFSNLAESKINSTDRSSVTNSSCNHSGLSPNTLKLIGNHYNRRFSIAVFGPHLAKISAHISKSWLNYNIITFNCIHTLGLNVTFLTH